MGPKYKVKSQLTGGNGNILEYTIVKRFWPFGYTQHYTFKSALEDAIPEFSCEIKVIEAVHKLNKYS